MSEPNVESICSSLQPLISQMFKEKMGICEGVIELYDVNSGKPSWEQKKNFKIGDRIKLKIPFAGQFLGWEVIFNCSLPHSPPDFDLNDESFLGEISIDRMEESVPSLLNWDFSDKKALFNVITELRALYLKYQVDVLANQNNNSTYEYASLLDKAKMNSDDIEVLVSGNTVHFLIRLHLELLKLDLPKEEQNYKVALATSFCPHMTSPLLIMSPDLEDMISDIHLPPFSKVSEDDSFGDYILNVIEQIEQEVLNTIVARAVARKHFLFELLGRFGANSVIDYDIMRHYNGNFLLSRKGFMFIFRVEIPKEFPIQRPTYKFQSIYNLVNGQPFTHAITGVPFNETWTVAYMVVKLLRFLDGPDGIMKFKEITIKSFKTAKNK